jgi:hypothetical protein
MKLKPKVQRLLAYQRKFASFPFLIKINHPTDTEFPMYFANASEDILYDGNIYRASSFSIEPPSNLDPLYS